MKALRLAGSEPETERCTVCGKEGALPYFSVLQGGTVCEDCAAQLDRRKDSVFSIDEELLNVLRFLKAGPMKTLEGLALKPEMENRVRGILRAWYAWQLGIDKLRSEDLQL